MDKEEIIYLHVLINDIHQYLQNKGDLDPSVHAEHKHIIAEPNDVYREKSVHEKAIRARMTDIMTAIDSPEEQTLFSRVSSVLAKSD